MLLPAIQYGDWPTVKRRMSKVVAQLKRGTGLIEVMTKDGMVEVGNRQGLLVMTGNRAGADPNFYCFAPWRQAWEAMFDMRNVPTVPSAIEDAVFAASLETSWSVLGILSADNHPWLISRERRQLFLQAALAVWDELDAVGPRYYSSLQGRALWAVPNNLHFVLANMGVPKDVLNAPLPPGGPRDLLQYAHPAAQA